MHFRNIAPYVYELSCLQGVFKNFMIELLEYFIYDTKSVNFVTEICKKYLLTFK